jgi:hypothetical protein
VLLLDRLFAGIKRVIELDGKVERLGRAVEGLHADLASLDRRLIRVETVLELASEGRFRPRLQNKDDQPPDG